MVLGPLEKFYFVIVQYSEVKIQHITPSKKNTKIVVSIWVLWIFRKNFDKSLYNFSEFYHLDSVPKGKNFIYSIFFIGFFIFAIFTKDQHMILFASIGLLLAIIFIYSHFKKYGIYEKVKKIGLREMD